MQIHAPVETLAEFHELDEGEILCGYLDGLSGAPCNLAAVSRSYWHGWRNGLVDAGFIERDAAQAKLDEAFSNLRDAA